MLKNLRNLILVLLFIMPIVACSQCKDINGTYTSPGGSEQSTTLTLLDNNKFNLQHESWQPGNYESRKITSSTGGWTCKDNQLTLELTGVKITAQKIVIGKNPLGLDENTKALQFKDVANDSILANEVLYLVQ